MRNESSLFPYGVTLWIFLTMYDFFLKMFLSPDFDGFWCFDTLQQTEV